MIAELGDAIDAELERERETLVALCGRMVQASSVNPPGRTSGVADIVRGYLADRQIEADIVAADDVAPNVVAKIQGKRPGRHVVFNAHMDTMEPTDEKSWTVPPFTLTRRDGRLYGLGVGNMKGALAAMCLTLAVLQRHRTAWAGKLSLTAVSDEVMFGERGTIFLLKARPDLFGDFMISGEGPGYMHLAIAEKGLLWLDIEAQGEGGHSSRAHAGRTAVARLACFISRIDDINALYGTPPEELAGVTGGGDGEGLRVSLNAGNLQAGTVRSQIATVARTQLDIRLPPGVRTDEIEKRLRLVAADIGGISVSRTKCWDANWTGVRDPLVKTITDAIRATRGVVPELVVRLPGSDARHWRDRGVPAVCYGPQPLLSAGIDDYVNEDDLVDCAKIYARTALQLMNVESAA